MVARLILMLTLMLPGAARAECRQALLLALDVSGSVDAREYRLQLDGLAAALMNPQVMAAFAAMPGAAVRVAVMEWSGPDFQRIIAPWRDVEGPASVLKLATELRGTGRVTADFSTAIGSALLRGAAEMSGQSGCWRRVIDVSGDGKSNTGPQPGAASAVLGDITVNGLVIGEPVAGTGRSTETAELTAYYRAYVLHGEDAFIETAQGFDDFEKAMVRKLLRELQVVAVSDADDAGPVPTARP